MNRELSIVEQDAFALIENAVNISRSMAEFNYKNLISALDENLQLWVAIKTLAEKNPTMPGETKKMLENLSNFVARKTFEVGGMTEEKIKESSVDFFVTTNLQISEGLLECVNSSYAEDEAYSLILSANAMKKAKETKNKDMINISLDNNLKLWVAIKTLLRSKDSTVPENIKSSILKLSEYVTLKTFELSKNFSDVAMDSLININMQIAQGLLEGSEDANRGDALALLSSALKLVEAKGNEVMLDDALAENLELWVKIKTLMQNKEHHLASDIKGNLVKLSEVIAAKSFELSKQKDEKKIDLLININLQICEGLLERKQIFN